MRKKHTEKPTEQPTDKPTVIDIVKGTLSDHEREAMIAAIIVALGATAAAATYAAKKHPELLSPWKLIGEGRLGQNIQDLRILHRARRARNSSDSAGSAK